MTEENHIRIQTLICQAADIAYKQLSREGVEEIDYDYEPDHNTYVVTIFYDNSDVSHLKLPVDSELLHITRYQIYREITHMHDAYMRGVPSKNRHH